jgi:hypothetical protein
MFLAISVNEIALSVGIGSVRVVPQTVDVPCLTNNTPRISSSSLRTTVLIVSRWLKQKCTPTAMLSIIIQRIGKMWSNRFQEGVHRPFLVVTGTQKGITRLGKTI